MFTRLAKSGLARLRLVQPPRIASGLHEAKLSDRTCSNDNLPGLRRPKGRRPDSIPGVGLSLA